MPKPKKPATPVVYTIGHSTHPLEEFIDLLRENGVLQLVDIRTIPRSRFNPQFNRDTLSKSLHQVHIKYIYMGKGLGGLRHSKADSPNQGWRNSSFRGFADYMQTKDFEKHLEELLELAEKAQTAIMCAEAVPWRCHRSLVSDALLVRNIEVEDIISPGKRHPHLLTPFAKVKGMKISYPEEQKENKPGSLFEDT